MSEHDLEHLRRAAKPWRRACTLRATWALGCTFGLLAGLWILLLARRDHPWEVVALSALTGIPLLRSFATMHDLAHHSFFPQRRLNDFVGTLLGVLLFTPYALWRYEHKLHHGAVGNLDRRGPGDVPLLTVDEYEGASWRTRLKYRLFRFPLVTFGVAGPYLFLVLMRRPARPGSPPRAKTSVHLTTAATALWFGALACYLGPKLFVLATLPGFITMSAGVMWMYNIQHFFPGVYWRREGDWDYTRGCLEGSSFYKLPRVMAWITMHAGHHHLHHLFPDIPTYFLPRVQAELERLELAKASPPVSWAASLRILRCALYDERARALVPFPRRPLWSPHVERRGSA